MSVQQLYRDQGLVAVDLNELLQSRHHVPPAALLDAIVDNVNEAFLPLEVRQELQVADHVIAYSQKWSMCCQDPGVICPAVCLDRQYPVCLPPVVLPTTRSTPPIALHLSFTSLSVLLSDPPDVRQSQRSGFSV